MSIGIELTYDQTDEVIRKSLAELERREGNDEIRQALNIVIAYHSIPGTYKEGMYDLESFVNEADYDAGN